MSRGFAGGLLWGGIVAILGLGVVSQVAPLPRPHAPPPTDVSAADVAPTPGEIAAADQTDPSVDEMPSAEAAVSSAAAEAPVDQTTPPENAAPDPMQAPAAPDTGEAVTDAPPAPDTVATSEPAGTPPDAAEPEAPAAVTPSAPVPSEPAPAAPGAAPQAPAVPVVEAAPVPGSSADGGLATAERTSPPAAPQDEPGPASAELPPPPPDEPLLTPPPAEGANPAPAEIALAEPEVETPPMTEVVPPEPETPAVAEETPAPDPQDDAAVMPETIAPDPGLPPVTGRLPRIGDAAPPAAEAAGNDLPTIEPAPDSPPVERFARAFDNPDKKPAFAILLIDTGGPQLDRETLAALPFPVTFLIDPLAPDAQAAEAIYRRAGQEVAMLATGIPEGATAADLEQTFQANAAILSQAVAIADLPTGGFQDNRPLASQVVPVVKAQGRGLVTFDRGLNAANQVALREDVPSALIFRRLDGEGETTPTIRRYLDRAAFKAAQEGRVAVLGETRPETIAALLEWTVEGRAAQVALAPLTAVLGRD